MRCAADIRARLEPVPRTGLPAWCDRFLAAPGSGDFFASRLWFDTLLAHALPAGAEPVIAATGEAMLPLLRREGRLGTLTGPYSLGWRPLAAGAEAMFAAGLGLGGLLRGVPPARLDTLEAEAPGLDAFLAGLRAAGLRFDRYAHFGNWHEALPAGLGWDDYLAARPSALQATIRRKQARAARMLRFELVAATGAGLERGIAGYDAVRGQSWKPREPFPQFDAALMRAAAAAGTLRLGLLWPAEGGAPAAAQYWIVDGGRAWLLKLCHDEKRREESPGTVLTAMMIRAMLQDGVVRALDFGRGDDPYKRLWVGERRQRIGLLLADPRHPAGLLALARQAAGHGTRRLRFWRGAEGVR